MAYSRTHQNSKTGEVLAQNVQVCNLCFKNFASTRAADKHYVREKYPRQSYCLQPEKVGLEQFKNTFGATIYR